jgi:hypothetical protein
MSYIRGVVGFLVGTLLPLSIWKYTELMYVYWWLPFIASPIFALGGATLMVGYWGVKDKFSAVDDRGNAIFSAFWSVLALMELIGLLIALGVVLD